MDIAIHKILDDGAVEEMCIANGGPWGGNTVNKALADLLGKYWSSAFVTKIQQERQLQWLMIERDFENAKRSSKINEKDSLFLFTINPPIIRLYQEETGNNIFWTKEDNSNFYTNDDCQLVISKTTVDQLFLPTVQHVLDKINHLISDKVIKVDYMFLVGGFTSCQYLTDSIKKAFKEKITILIPDAPQLAVLKGAVKFGRNPNVIKKRIMPRTYGFSKSILYDPCVHDSSKMYLCEGKERCDIFHKLVTVGQHVDVDEEIREYRAPLRSDQTVVPCTIFETTEEDVMYIDHPSIKNTHISLNVPVPDAADGGDRDVIVYIKFGTSEIRARGRRRDDQNGEWYHTVVEYTPYKTI